MSASLYRYVARSIGGKSKRTSARTYWKMFRRGSNDDDDDDVVSQLD